MSSLLPQHDESALFDTTCTETLHTVHTSYKVFRPFSNTCVSRCTDLTVVGWLQLMEEMSLWEWTCVRGCHRLDSETFLSKRILEGVKTLRLFWDKKKTVFLFPLFLFCFSAHCSSVLFVSPSLLE